MRKRLIFSSIACLLLLSFTFAACAEEEVVEEEEEEEVVEEEEEVVNYIKIGVIGPMQFVQGEHHWLGAEMARDEINDAGGIVLNGEKYLVELVKADSNEILSVTDASAAMERLLTVDKVDFVVGGFRTEAVFPMQDVAVENQKIFICCGSSTPELCEQVAKDYDTYKYFFRGTPFNSVYLVGTDFLMLEMVGNMLKEELSKRIGDGVQIREETDPGLIAGAVVGVGDLVVDGSLKYSLEEAARNVRRSAGG